MADIMSDEDAKCALEACTAPRVTAESITAKISEVDYMMHGFTTICVITMANGFKSIGSSTPASVANFNAGLGQKYAYDNAFRPLWVHEGYLLRERLSHVES